MSKKVAMPFERSNDAPQYEYTNAMYKEDYRIAHWCVYKKYAFNYPEKSISKDDLVQYCLMRLWQKRPTYDPTKSKYSTWAIMVCRSVLLYYPIIKQQQRDAERDDLDKVTIKFDDGDTFTLLDKIGEPDKEPTADLVRIVRQAADNIRTPIPRAKAKQVIDLFLSGKIEYQTQAGAILGCTRERIRQLLAKVRKHALQILANGNTFSRQECERQLTITQQTPRPYLCTKCYYSRKPRPRKQRERKPRERKPRPVIDIDLSQATFKQLYVAKGFTQQELANQIGVTKRTIAYWSRGCSHFKPNNIKKLAAVFNCTYEQMQAIILRKE